MTAASSEFIEHAYANDSLWNTVEELVDIGSRMTGSDGEKRGIDILERILGEIGTRNPLVDEFDVPGWQRGSAILRTESHSAEISAQHEIIALPGTSSGDITAELVDLGHGLPSDFENVASDGEILITTSHTPDDHDRSIHRLDKYVNALEAGAVGFVFGNYKKGCLPLTGDVGWHNRPGSIPAVGVSAEVRHRLARYCADNTSTVRLQVDCRTGPATSRNVKTVLGPERGKEVVLAAHVDTYEISEGARDNGVGCALVAEIGRLLTTLDTDLETPVRLVIFGSEETGLHGSYHWIETNDRDNIKCVINIDGAGDTRDLHLMTNGFTDMVDPFETVANRFGVPLRTEDEPNTTTDAWPFAVEGVPAVTVASDRRGSGRGWGHTHADTLDKLDSRVLRDLAIILTAVVLACVDDDFRVSGKSPSSVLSALDERTERRMRTLGQLPLE